jgi:hypothetical protein
LQRNNNGTSLRQDLLQKSILRARRDLHALHALDHAFPLVAKREENASLDVASHLSSANQHVVRLKERIQKSNALQSVTLQEIFAEKIVVPLVGKSVKLEDNARFNARHNSRIRSRHIVPRTLYHSVREIALQNAIRNVQ